MNSGDARAVGRHDVNQENASSTDRPAVSEGDANKKSLVLIGHTDWVTGVAFSPDGKHVASCSHDRTLKVWDADTGQELLTLEKQNENILDGHPGPIDYVSFSPDGKYLASASCSDRFAYLWNAETSRCLRCLYAHEAGVKAIVFSQDGKRLVTCGSDPAGNTVKVWDGKPEPSGHILGLDGSDVSSVAFSPDGKRLISVSMNDERGGVVWDATTGEELFALGTSGKSHFVVYSPDGRRIATANETAISLWDARTGKMIRNWNGPGPITRLRYSFDGRRLASCGLDKTVRLWDASSGKQLSTLVGHTDVTCDVAFSPNGRRLASASRDRAIRIWNLPLPEMEVAEQEKLSESREERNHGANVLIGHTDWVTGVAFSPDGKALASSSRDGTIKVWDVATGRESLTLKRTGDRVNDGHFGAVQCVAFSPDGRYLVSGGASDKAAYIWNATTGQVVRRLSAHNAGIRSVAYSPNGRWIATASSDNTVKLWDANPESHPGREVMSLDHPMALSVAFSPNSKWLASAGRDKLVRVWDSASGELQLSTIHPDQTLSLAFSPDGKRLASACGSVIDIWDATTGESLVALQGHRQAVVCVQFSPDGKRLVSSGWDKVVKLWDVDTREELAELKGHANSVWAVAFSRDGARLATASADRTVRIWTVPAAEGGGDAESKIKRR